MGHRKPRLHFSSSSYASYRDVSRGGAQMPWGKVAVCTGSRWKLPKLRPRLPCPRGKAAACSGSRWKLPKLRPCPRREPKPDATAPSILAAPTVTARALLAIPAVRALPRPGGDARKILCYVASPPLRCTSSPLGRCPSPYTAGPIGATRAVHGQWACWKCCPHWETASGRGLGAAGGAPLPDAIDWQLPSHALPGRAAGKALARGFGPLYCWRCSRYPHRRRLRRQVAVPGSRGWREGHAPCMQAYYTQAACPVGISGSKKGSSYEKSLFMPVAGNALAAWRL